MLDQNENYKQTGSPVMLSTKLLPTIVIGFIQADTTARKYNKKRMFMSQKCRNWYKLRK